MPLVWPYPAGPEEGNAPTIAAPSSDPEANPIKTLFDWYLGMSGPFEDPLAELSFDALFPGGAALAEESVYEHHQATPTIDPSPAPLEAYLSPPIPSMISPKAAPLLKPRAVQPVPLTAQPAYPSAPPREFSNPAMKVRVMPPAYSMAPSSLPVVVMRPAVPLPLGPAAVLPRAAPALPPSAIPAPAEDASTEAIARQDGKFPLFIGGRCPHKAHWARIRAKRNYVYFFCKFCGVGWCSPKATLKATRK